ncbi:NYN domain-containing protein [Algivirga pacifica]
MNNKKELSLAVLIDADNVPYKNVKGMMDEMAKFGNPTIKRIYGDWTKPTVAGWKSVLLEHAITPVQQYSYTTGKNATDSAMIIDAMDILHSGKVDGFCLVSSDSDFTRLATRLRESSMFVLGLGEKKTPRPFIVACDKFIYIEILDAHEEEEQEPAKTSSSNKKTTTRRRRSGLDKIDHRLIQLFRTTINDLGDDEGWAFLGQVGELILKKRPDFDPRNYGFNKLTDMLESMTKVFEVERRDSGKGARGSKQIYVRVK